MTSAQVKYYAVAAVVSLLWWVLLQLAPNMREILGGPGVLEVSSAVQLALFAAAGLVTAFLFRRAISKACGARSVVLGVALPFVAAEAFCVLLVTYHSVIGTSDTWHAVIWGPIMAAGAFYVVIPLGVATQYIMQWVATRYSSTAGGPQLSFIR
jgi:hypothetical protein